MLPLQRFVPSPCPAAMSPVRQAALSAALYVLLSSIHILVSGFWAARAATTPQQLFVTETVKGIAFVLVTGGLFFAISLVLYGRIRRQEETIFRQEKALRQAEKGLVAAMSSATVAHDLNNLLMALSGLVEGLKGRQRGDTEAHRMCAELEVGIDKLSHLARRLASVVGRAVPEKEAAVDLSAALHELIAVARRHPDGRFCRITPSEIAPLTLVLNRTLLEEAVVNLLINAAQAAGSEGQIEVRLAAKPEGCVLEVHDSGPGVPDDILADIFEPCFTTKPNGSGIGLVSVKAFAASCEAGIEVSRSPLGGALFRIRIPTASQPPSPSAGASPAAHANAG